MLDTVQDPVVEGLQAHIALLQTRLADVGLAYETVLRDILAHHEEELTSQDRDAMIRRLRAMVGADLTETPDVWYAEQDFEVVTVYTVRVTGTVRARHKDDVVRALENNPPTIGLDDDGALTHATIDPDWSHDVIEGRRYQ